MKLKSFKLGILLVLTTLFVTSCSKDESATQESVSENLTVEDTQKTSEADVTTDQSLFVIETAYVELEEDAGRSVSLFSDCTTITVNFENDVTFVTIDFGTGCELQNGNIVSGKIHITYGPLQNQTRTIDYTFEDFTLNNKSIEGGGTIFRERQNAAGNPQSTFHNNIIITFPNELTATLSGVRQREWIEGVGSGTWTDNVFLVTGNWSIELSNGHTREALVIDPLRREATCPHFVSGVVEVTRNQTTGTLDFGDGTCDNIAILTVNGIEHTIILN
jgi:hypothetical protein